METNIGWIEIIDLRVAKPNLETIKEMIELLVKDLQSNNKNMNIQILAQMNVANDFSIHFMHSFEPIKATGSAIGVRIAESFRSFCQVNHTVWKYIK